MTSKNLVPAAIAPIHYLLVLNSCNDDNATKKNNVKVLFKAGYVRNEWACAIAALNGNIEMLKWLREIGFPWDKKCYTLAERRGHDKVVQWLHENGCPTV